MEEQESTTPLAVEINFLSELLRSNRQQHRAAKHFRLSCALVARVRRLAPPPADNERAAAACDAAAAVALAAARGVREDLARGFFAALNACWLACLARVVELLRRDAADLRAAAAPAAAAAPRRETNDSGPLTDHPTTAPPAFARWKRPDRAVVALAFDRLAAALDDRW